MAGFFVRNNEFGHLIGRLAAYGLQFCCIRPVRNGVPLRFVADVPEYEIGGDFLNGYFEDAVRIGDGAPVGSLDPYVGGRQGFFCLCVKDLSAYDVYGLLGMRSPDTGHSSQHGNKNQFAEH